MRQGNAKLTATTQHFLDTCPAVKSWTPSADESTATFIYDETVEVAMVPDGVDFSDDDIESVATVDGVRLRRREKVGPRGGKTYIYQSEAASQDWGYWYDSARQAARESNSTDKVVR